MLHLIRSSMNCHEYPENNSYPVHGNTIKKKNEEFYLKLVFNSHFPQQSGKTLRLFDKASVEVGGAGN